MARETRSKQFNVRLTDSEAAALVAVSEAAGLSASEVLRRQVRLIGGFGPVLDADERAETLRLCDEMRRCGINLNQIAYALNRGLVPTNERTVEVIGQLARNLADAQRHYVSLCGRREALASNALKGSDA